MMDLASFGPLVGSLIQAGSPMISTALQMGIGEIPIVGGIVGPLVGMAAPEIVRMIAQKLGAPPNATPDQLAAKITADPSGARAALASLEEAHSFTLAQQKQADDYAVASQAQQVAIGTAQISNPSLFIAGPRPMIEWGLGGLLMVAKTLPFAVWGLANIGLHLTAPPDMDITTLGFIAALLGVTVASHAATQITGTAPTKIGGTSTVAVVKRAR